MDVSTKAFRTSKTGAAASSNRQTQLAPAELFDADSQIVRYWGQVYFRSLPSGRDTTAAPWAPARRLQA